MTIGNDRLGWIAHYYDVVESAWQDYLEAEHALTAAAGTELAPRPWASRGRKRTENHRRRHCHCLRDPRHMTTTQITAEW